MTDYKYFGKRVIRDSDRGDRTAQVVHAIGVVLVLVLAMGLAGADDLRTAQRRRAAQGLAPVSESEKVQVVRLQRAALLAAYSSQGMKRAELVAEVRR